jgi:cob(I)alamin adenosyltransferase
MTLISDSHITVLEQAIDELDAALPPLKNFILPGGSCGAAVLHVARGVCRRAERRTVTLAHTPGHEVAPRIIRYLNRLGDFLFVAARFANLRAGAVETQWRKPAPPTSS